MPESESAVLDREPDVAEEAACVICRCTENAACEGGCSWVPNELNVDVCSACCERLAEAIGR